VKLRQPGADRVYPVANDSLADLALQAAFVEAAAMEESVVTCTVNFIHPTFRLSFPKRLSLSRPHPVVDMVVGGALL
jgi:hypothetical protein